MTTEGWTPLEEALIGMRDPLSRIQLAAGELGHSAAAGCVGEIQRAVGELDLRLEDTLASLRRRRNGAPEPSDLRSATERVVRELAGSLSARRIDLVLAPLPGTPVPGDASLVRRALYRVLLGLGQWLDTRSARIEVALLGVDDGALLRIEAQVEGGVHGGVARDILAPLRGFALGEELRIEAREDADRGRATISAQLPAGVAP